ncbi:FG-GAP repeat domain-containing protein [Planctomycetota bacterium]
MTDRPGDLSYRLRCTGSTASLVAATGRAARVFEFGPPTTSGISVALGDLNGDGRLDIVCADYYSGTVSLLLGLGNGAFERPVPFLAEAHRQDRSGPEEARDEEIDRHADCMHCGESAWRTGACGGECGQPMAHGET